MWPISGALKCTGLFKKGDKSDPSNSRFLAVSPVLGKVLLKILATRLHAILERFNISPKSFFGFRRHLGTLESTLGFTGLREGPSGYTSPEMQKTSFEMVDFRKCFPSSGSRLVRRAAAYALGLNGSSAWSAIWASQTGAVCRFEGAETFPTRHGVKEGCVSSPLVFLLTYACLLSTYLLRRGGDGGVLLQPTDELYADSRDGLIKRLLLPEGPSAVDEYLPTALTFADGTNRIE